MIRALREHWPEYLLEATELGTFMISAGVFTALFEYPDSPVRRAIGDPFLRRMFIGIAMGLTAIGLIFSPLGKRSGAHMNPAVTLTFLRLGKLKPWDAFWPTLDLRVVNSRRSGADAEAGSENGLRLVCWRNM